MNTGSKNRRRAPWWKRHSRFLGAVAGLLTAGLASDASSVVAQNGNYRSVREVPAAWQDFAKQLQARFEQRIAADDEKARHFQDYVARRGETSAAPLSFRLRTWILADGKVERVEFDGVDNDVAVALRALLINGEVGVPPPDMLQPLHLRLSLRASAEPAQKP
ncbi:MAG: hypothetical protein V7608_855 [Hyphomicrobiales bacterium]|jgi:hypothetical protein